MLDPSPYSLATSLEMDSPSEPTGKTVQCRHKGTCLHNASMGVIRGAVLGAGLSSAFFLLGGLASGRLFKRPALITKLISEDFFRYAGFLATLTGGYKGILCLMRRVTHDERTCSMVAGLISAFGLVLMKGESKKTWALYLFVRALVSLHTKALERHLVPEVPYGVFLLFAFVCCVLLYARAFEPTTLSKSYYNFVSYMTAGTKNDTTLLDTFEKVHRHNIQTGK